ncbi:class I SAM-dependent methyltransferase [Aliikangiella coralliicola]|uniref:Class I SAM-dependent methyltransferase n=1 Tax=Aliikangiella coralliicola TaxID=2592383 RepID=A0A545UAW3_9GAMM|nr:class I SAM-dependent methyltransferase [Aliikangiella coralliicola]TQV86605.1 class I SAM-dependent methyltransferase [Aliikangiella coralliicola]
MNKNLSHWSNYWQGGNLTSLPQDFLENYDGEIASLWKSAFSLLSSPKSHILDLCTGNGAIALLAAKYSQANQLQMDITGVDAAKISKNSILSKYSHLEELLQAVNFIGECKVEDISLQSDRFDLITSQYGIEYCDWEQVAIQVCRLLKPGAHFVFISHASSTAILSTMEQEKEDYSLLQKAGVFSALAAYLEGRSSHRDMVRKIKKAFKKVNENFAKSQSELLAGVLGFMQKIIITDKGELDKHKDEIRFIYQQHIFAFARLQDVLGVSNKIKENPDWYLVFQEKGLNLVQQGEILQAGSHNAGNFYKFIKPE